MLRPFLGRDQRSSWKEEPSCPLNASGLQTASGKADLFHPRGRGTLSGCFEKRMGWLKEENALWNFNMAFVASHAQVI